jgi:hypothetical protein
MPTRPRIRRDLVASVLLGGLLVSVSGLGELRQASARTSVTGWFGALLAQTSNEGGSGFISGQGASSSRRSGNLPNPGSSLRSADSSSSAGNADESRASSSQKSSDQASSVTFLNAGSSSSAGGNVGDRPQSFSSSSARPGTMMITPASRAASREAGCYNAAGQWVTDRDQCAAPRQQAPFVANQQASAPSSRDANVQANAEVAFHEDMSLRFRGEDLEVESRELLARFDAALEHLTSARDDAEGADDIAARIENVASRVDALRVSLTGRTLTPAERDRAETELGSLVDEGLAALRDLHARNPEPIRIVPNQLASILGELDFIVGTMPVVFELMEDYEVKVPDVALIGFVEVRAKLESAHERCVNAGCMLLPEMLSILEDDVQAPLMRAMEEAMEPQEVAALMVRIEELFAARRAAR